MRGEGIIPLKNLSGRHRVRRCAVLAVLTICFTDSISRAVYTATVLYPLAIPSGEQHVHFSWEDANEVVGGADYVKTIDGYTNSDYGTAFSWSSPNGSITSYAVPGYQQSYINGKSGGTLFGVVENTNTDASIWNSATSITDIAPTGYSYSRPLAMDGTNIAGIGTEAGQSTQQAILWTNGGSAMKVLPTDQPGNASALGISGTNIVGGENVGSAGQEAVLWQSLGTTLVDLGGNFSESIANAVYGGQQVGAALNGTSNAAVLWMGSASTARILGPANSTATLTNGAEQAGNVGIQAYLWYGDSASTLNLHALLPASGSWTSSYPLSFDSNHNLFGYAQGTYNGTTGYFAVEWSSPTLNFTGSSSTWNINSNTNFNAGSGAVAYHDGDFVSLDDAHNTGNQYTLTLTAGPGTVNYTGNVSPGSITVNTTKTYTFNGVGIGGVGTLTKAGTGTLVLNNANAFTGATFINQGTLTLGTTGSLNASPVTVGDGTNAAVLQLTAPSSGILDRNFTALTITSTGSVKVAARTGTARTLVIVANNGLSVTGSFDLTNNDMDLAGADLPTITAAIKQGFGSGTWNGTTGINSSSAATDAGHLTALGILSGSAYPPGSRFDGIYPLSSDVLVKYTYYGDADLSGTVDGNDYTLIDNGFGKHLTGWQNGDFNYDGTIDGSDYSLIDNSFNQQSTTPAVEVAVSTAEISTSSVPEPASLPILVGLATIAIATAAPRRRASRSSFTVHRSALNA
jgi:autotransporter-associated beta strand protein